MASLKHERIASGIYRHARGFRVVVVVGARQTRRAKETTFPADTPLETMQAWQSRTRRALEAAPRSAPGPSGTLTADARTYLATVTSMPSYAARRADLEAWLPAFGHRHRHSLSPVELAATLNQWAADGYAASTLNHRRQALRAVYQLLDPGMPAPIEGTERRTPPPLEARAIAWPDALELIAAFPATKTGAFLRVMAHTGLPPARITRLTPIQFNATAGTLFLEGRQKGAGTLSKTIPLTAAAVAALRDHFQWFPSGGGVAKNSWTVVFHRAVGRVNHARAKAGRPPLPATLRPYDLRHTYGTEAYRRTDDIRAIAETLDVTVETALRYTLGAVSDQMRKVRDAMNGAPDWHHGHVLASGTSQTARPGLGQFSSGLGRPTHQIVSRRNLAENGTITHSADPRPNPPRLVKMPGPPRKNA